MTRTGIKLGNETHLLVEYNGPNATAVLIMVQRYLEESEHSRFPDGDKRICIDGRKTNQAPAFRLWDYPTLDQLASIRLVMEDWVLHGHEIDPWWERPKVQGAAASLAIAGIVTAMISTYMWLCFFVR